MTTANAPCPCGTGQPYAQCCGRYHAGALHLQAPDAERLMRSRYSAYTMGLADYLLATLASAIGLLLRLDWARRVFIGMLVLAIVANLLGLWFQHEVVQSVVDATLSSAPLPQKALGVFGGFVTAARAMGAAMTLVACALLGWIIHRLMSAGVRQEFA